MWYTGSVTVCIDEITSRFIYEADGGGLERLGHALADGKLKVEIPGVADILERGHGVLPVHSSEERYGVQVGLTDIVVNVRCLKACAELGELAALRLQRNAICVSEIPARSDVRRAE